VRRSWWWQWDPGSGFEGVVPGQDLLAAGSRRFSWPLDACEPALGPEEASKHGRWPGVERKELPIAHGLAPGISERGFRGCSGLEVVRLKRGGWHDLFRVTL
jgi:hypothetical protein